MHMQVTQCHILPTTVEVSNSDPAGRQRVLISRVYGRKYHKGEQKSIEKVCVCVCVGGGGGGERV